MIEKPLPSISLVRYQLLQHGNRCFFAARGSDGDFAKEGSDARKVRDFGEKSADLHVRVFAWLQAPEQLQDELLAIQD